MRLFTCLLATDGQGIPDTVRRFYERLPRSRGLASQWHSIGQASVLIVGDDREGPPLVATHGSYFAAGMVRLDNRAELAKWSKADSTLLNDLDLVLHTVALHGTRYVPQFLGDFAFVVWHAPTRTAVAAVDAFSLKKLYYVERNGWVAFASRAEALADDDCYEPQYLAELVAMCSPSSTLSVYLGVHPVPAASIAVVKHGRLSLAQYWAADDFETEMRWATAEREAAGLCRDLLAESVQLRLGGSGETWSQLSGGLDSSAVVGITQWLLEDGAIPHGLAGTVTYADRVASEADEREYSNLVIDRWRVRNETILNPPFWHDPRATPPRTDQPGFTLPFYPREQELCAIVRGAGGRVLLTGIGGDELFTGAMLFFADWLAQGRVWPAIREMARRAAIGRVSFWELAYRNAMLPILPPVVRNVLLADRAPLPPWVRHTAARSYRLGGRGIMASEYAGRIGHKYHDAIARNVTAIGSDFEYGTLGEVLDVRHPFLYRPLVEFALRLPPELCVRPHARKWVLREAMRGILPEVVRARVGKGGPAELYAWSLTAQRPLLEELVREPILADLGVVDGGKLREAFDEMPHQPRRGDQLHATLHMTLVIEAWLQMRVGRWPRGDHLSSAA
jgi:asparagine synthase (glutamine-hydrolysing)